MAQSKTAAIDAARKYAEFHQSGGQGVKLLDADVEFGVWDASKRTFTLTKEIGDAVKVTCKRDSSHGSEAPLFFGRVFSQQAFAQTASAVAMANPRDIAFVILELAAIPAFVGHALTCRTTIVRQ